MDNAIARPASAGTEEFRIGDVFGRTFELFGRRFAPFLALTVIAYLPYYLAQFAIGRPGSTGGYVATGVGFVLGTICAALASAAVTYGVVQELRGRPFAVGESLSVALQRLVPVIGVAICVGVLAGLGMMLLIVPGLIVVCMYYVATPACIVERLGVFASLSRSAELTKGHRWKVFGLVLLVALATIVVSFVLGLLGGTLGRAPLALISAVWQAVVGTFGAILVGVLYFRLRTAREGIDIDQIASVFA
jgi:hypothetical protein